MPIPDALVIACSNIASQKFARNNFKGGIKVRPHNVKVRRRMLIRSYVDTKLSNALDKLALEYRAERAIRSRLNRGA